MEDVLSADHIASQCWWQGQSYDVDDSQRNVS